MIAFFADLLQAKKDRIWGYITKGGTENNMYGSIILPVQWNIRQFDSPNQQFCGTRCKDQKNLAQKYY